jgi:hypothetical protein
MFPVNVDPGWYEKYWLSERPKPRHRSVARHLKRFAVVVVLLAGGGAVLNHLHAHHGGDAYPDWEQE